MRSRTCASFGHPFPLVLLLIKEATLLRHLGQGARVGVFPLVLLLIKEATQKKFNHIGAGIDPVSISSTSY